MHGVSWLRSRRDRRDPRLRVPDPPRGCDGVPAQQFDEQELRLAAVPHHAGGPGALAQRVRDHARDVGVVQDLRRLLLQAPGAAVPDLGRPQVRLPGIARVPYLLQHAFSATALLISWMLPGYDDVIVSALLAVLLAVRERWHQQADRGGHPEGRQDGRQGGRPRGAQQGLCVQHSSIAPRSVALFALRDRRT